jgi:FKBP-type peptidyl-prolyl cis-trans isomerase FkpA
MTKYLITIATFVFLFASCKQKTHKTPGGLEYKIFNESKGNKIAAGDLVYFKLIARTKDTMVMNSWDNPDHYYQVMVHDKIMPGNFDEGLTMLAPGDSAMFSINADTFYNNYFHQPTPKFIKPAAMIDFNINIDSVVPKKTMDERNALQQQQMMEDQKKESTLIDDYLKTSNAKFTKTETGLYYVVTKKTTGRKAKAGDMVSVNYTGKLLNGTIFDSSDKSGKPLEFPVGGHQVIPGWDEAFQILNEGEKATLLIPSSLGYGARGAGADIAPYSPLLFDVELVKVTPAKK